jgi:beta-lactamase regulating signal transducer with metallopeptidase domain/peroxiredoxin
MNALFDGINRLGDSWWQWTVHAGWQSAVVGCLLLALVACGRRWPSSVRYWLLVIALLKFAVPPLWSAPIGLFSHIAVADRPRAATPETTRVLANPIAVAIGPDEFAAKLDRPQKFASDSRPAPSAASTASRERMRIVDSGDDKPLAPSAIPIAAPDTTPNVLSSFEACPLSWKSLLLGLNLLGTFGILCWIAAQARTVRKIVARSRSVSAGPIAGPIAESLQRVNARLSWRHSAQILVSPDVASPLAAGTFRPTVVLPLSAETLSARELDAILIHELTHLRRGDAWLAWVQVLLCAAWWFHPVIWLVNRSLRRVREDCCDDAILLSGVATGSEYCQILLRVARDTTARHADLLACHMAGRLHPLGDRLRRIMDARVRRWRRTPLAAALAVVVLACVALPGLGRQAQKSVAAPADVQIADQGPKASASQATSVADKSLAEKPFHEIRNEAARFDGKQYLAQTHQVRISGSARNERGEPVAGATVLVVANNRYGIPNPVLANVKTDAKGRYDLPQLALPVLEFPPQPLPQPTQGVFQVVATAAGYGYTWRRSVSYRPGKRPATTEEAANGPQVVYAGEPLQLDLHFAAEARVHGRITNDLGEPLGGAEIEFGAIRDVRRGDSPNNVMWRCGFLSEGPMAAEGACDVVRFLPREFLSTRAHADGRFEMHGLPRDAVLISQIEYGHDYSPHSLTLQTTKGSSDRHTIRAGYDGELNYTFAAPREIRMLVTEEQTGKPVKGVQVRSRGRSVQRSGAGAATAGDGVATLRLAPGKYTLIVEPPSILPLVRVTKELNVEKSRRQEIGFSLDRAAVASIKTIETGTGKPVEGAAIFSEEQGVAGEPRLQSQTVFVDNPVTDAAGNLRAFVPMGRRRFFARRDVRSHSQHTWSDWVELTPGKETTVTLSLSAGPVEPDATPRTPVTMSAAQQRFEKVRELWHDQYLLCSRGRYRIRNHSYLRGDVPLDRLQQLLASCEGKTPDECLAILGSAFPALHGKLARQELIVDRDRLRGWSIFANSKTANSSVPDYIFVFNGQETITYQRDNAQVDIYGIDNAMVGYNPQLSDLLGMAGTASSRPRIIVSGDKWQGSVTEEGDRLRFVLGDASTVRSEYLVDAKSGFPYHSIVDARAYRSAGANWEFSPHQHPNGGMVPTMRFHAVYDNQKLRYAQFTIIDEVELMNRVPPESFVVTVDPGTNVIDHRGIPRDEMSSNWRPRSAVVTEPVGDVVARANGFQRPQPPVLKKGDPAPALDVAKWVAGGATESTPAIEGKIVLVSFSAHWCGLCRPEWAQLEATARHFADNGVLVVGLFDCRDAESDVRQDIAKEKLTYAVGLDRPGSPMHSFGGKTFKAYGIDAVPESAVIGRDGRIAYIGRFEQALATVDRLVKSK